jgi:hypothetical protein
MASASAQPDLCGEVVRLEVFVLEVFVVETGWSSSKLSV